MKDDQGKIKKQQIWEDGFDGHELAQMRRLAKLTFREKVELLESMQKLQLQLSKQKKSK